MNEDKEYLQIVFEVSSILKEKYSLSDQEVFEYLEEYGLKDLYKFFPGKITTISYSALAKNIYNTVTVERLCAMQDNYTL